MEMNRRMEEISIKLLNQTVIGSISMSFVYAFTGVTMYKLGEWTLNFT